MRVISGKAGRLKLKTPAGMDVRPTTDRIKETLFNIINNDLPDCRFLDLFSGSGGIGIEALSRGAKRAVFVDNNKASLECIRDNLKSTRLDGSASVMAMDVMSAIGRLHTSHETFDIIFMDPPYEKGLETEVLQRLSEDRLLDKDGFIIIEASSHTVLELPGDSIWTVYRDKSYGSNHHIFIRYSESERQ